ncbi:MAG: SWIM zinc finger family protein [bacterium]|nr:SWIM zinc finger family protein [bacterium]
MTPPRFNLDALRERMSEGSFANGLDLAQDGAVTLVAVEDEVATAHVRGGDLYVVELRPPADGTCTCPGFDKFGACKHQVATAAAVNTLDGAGLQKVQSRMARLRDGLALESQAALIERLVDLARRRPEVLAALEGG